MNVICLYIECTLSNIFISQDFLRYNFSQISILQHQRKFRIELSVIAFNKQENLKGKKEKNILSMEKSLTLNEVFM